MCIRDSVCTLKIKCAFCRYVGTVVFGAGILMYRTSHNKAEMARALIDTSKFMAQPITDIKILDSNKNDMKTKMELMIMKIQVSRLKYSDVKTEVEYMIMKVQVSK